MARLLHMPEVAANATEAVLREWSVSENAEFTGDDVIATVETDKAAVDVEADAAGTMLKTLAETGARVEVGSPIAVIGEPGETVDDMDALLAQLGIATTEAPAPKAPVDAEPVAEPVRTGQSARSAQSARAAQSARTAQPGSGPNGQRTFASPLARRLAREAGLSVDEITGTGPHGRVVRRDVEAAISGRSSMPAPSAGTSGERPGSAAYTDIPHSRIRKAIASRLTESKQSVPHYYVRATCRVDEMLRLREGLNATGTLKVSVNDLVLKAVARSMVLVPEMNVIWTPEAMRTFSSADIAAAIATDGGLVTPVLRSVERTPISEVSAQTKDYVERAKAGKLKQNELEGGSFCVTNLGMFGTEEFAAIINPPHSGILAVGATKQEPVVHDGELTVATVMRVTLSVDHRAVDGAVAAQWLQAFVSVVENPLQILA